MAPVLEIDSLCHDYGGRPVFQDFRMSLPQGGQCLLLGPSGSGKSTLINLICGLQTPSSGTIRISGENISRGSEAQRDAVRRRNIAVVFQTLRLVSALTVGDNLKLAAKLAGGAVSSREIRAELDELGIADKAACHPYQLSQGEAQRAAVARALIVKPRLLIADEPTSALDDANATAIAGLFQRLAAVHGTSLLIATHDARLRPFFETTRELEPVA